jgi:AcrR family transcriptional regulator
VSSARTGPRPADGPQAHVAEIQRSRLLAAAVRACDELGFANTSVADIVNRSGISRRTFYEMFSSREECLAAALEQTLGLIEQELAAAGLDGLGWRERVRVGLSAILSFFDREPILARMCIVHTLGGGPPVLARREQIVAQLVREIDHGRSEGSGRAGATKLTAEGVVGAVLAIVYTRLLAREQRRPLAGLLGELMAMIVLPYLGPAAARREQAQRLPRAPRRRGRNAERSPAANASDPLESMPMRVTYRTARVLEGLLELPGASNRRIAERAEIVDPGQISKLLWRLERLGLATNGVAGRPQGEPNAWRLTAKGEAVARSLRRHSPGPDRGLL